MITCLFNQFNQMMKQDSCSNQKAQCSSLGQYPDTKNLSLSLSIAVASSPGHYEHFYRRDKRKSASSPHLYN